MNNLIFISIFLFGLFLLWKSGDWSVNSAIRFSKIFQVHGFLVGFLIFSLATNLPEITTAIISSIENVPEFASGDFIGSAFVNLTLQLGIASIIAKKLPIKPQIENSLTKNILLVFTSATILLFFSKTHIYLGVIIALIYLVSFISLPKVSPPQKVTKIVDNDFHFFSPKIDVIIKLIFSLILLVFSGWLTVKSAMQIANAFQIPIVYFGATFMAVGTSLPELTLEIHAIKRKEYSLALGDILGSSVLNISILLGLLFIFNPPFPLLTPKIIFPFFVPVTLLILFRRFRTHYFSKIDGIILIGLFCLYALKISLT